MSEEYMEENLITVTDEDGTEHKFEIIDAIETDESRYVALLPYIDDGEEEDDDEDTDLIVLEVVDEDGEDVLNPIEDEEKFNFVAKEFEKRLADMFDIELE